MKTFVCAMAAAGFLVLAGTARCAEQNTAVSPGEGFLRGTVNMLTAWMEVPREVTCQSVQTPVIGAVPGLVRGGCFTFLRLFAASVDVISWGHSGDGIYDESVPQYVWQAPWLPQPAPAPAPEPEPAPAPAPEPSSD